MQKHTLRLVLAGLCLLACESVCFSKKISLRSVIPLLDHEYMQLIYNFERDSLCFARFDQEGALKGLLPIELNQLNLGDKFSRLVTIRGIAQVEGVIISALVFTYSEQKEDLLFLVFSPLQSAVKFVNYGFEGNVKDIMLEETSDQNMVATCLVMPCQQPVDSKLVKATMKFSKQCDCCTKSEICEEYEAHLVPVNGVEAESQKQSSADESDASVNIEQSNASLQTTASPVEPEVPSAQG